MTDGPRAARWRSSHAAWEPWLGAIVAVDAAAVGRLDAAAGPLAGLAVGVKDVVDVAGLATRNGSAACAEAGPAPRDATVVAALRAAGAAIVAKTASTAFAFTDPAPTRNPFGAELTPGGSSSGSGAAVGAGLLDLAIGTQTAGSLCRPAAYCGAVAFKPSLGALPTKGMTPLAPSFDTLGFIARDVALVAKAFGACVGAPTAAMDIAAASVLRAAVDPAAPMEASTVAALEQAETALEQAGAAFRDAPSTVDLGRVVADHRVAMLHEAAKRHGRLLATAERKLGPRFRAALREGEAISADARDAALGRLADARARFWDGTAGMDFLLAPPTPGPASDREGGTGYQHLLTPWTVFGGPLVCLPWGADATGRPLSVMLAARPGDDARLLAFAAHLETLAPQLPKPTPPDAS